MAIDHKGLTLYLHLDYPTIPASKPTYVSRKAPVSKTMQGNALASRWAGELPPLPQVPQDQNWAWSYQWGYVMGISNFYMCGELVNEDNKIHI